MHDSPFLSLSLASLHTPAINYTSPVSEKDVDIVRW